MHCLKSRTRNKYCWESGSCPLHHNIKFQVNWYASEKIREQNLCPVNLLNLPAFISLLQIDDFVFCRNFNFTNKMYEVVKLDSINLFLQVGKSNLQN